MWEGGGIDQWLGEDQEQLLRLFQAGSVGSHHLSNLMNYVWKEEKFTKTANNAKYTAIMEASAKRLTKCTYIEFIVSIAITKMLNETKCEWWDKCRKKCSSFVFSMGCALHGNGFHYNRICTILGHSFSFKRGRHIRVHLTKKVMILTVWYWTCRQERYFEHRVH